MQNKQIGLVKEQVEREQQKLSEKFEKAVNYVHAERKQLQQLKEYEQGYLERIKTEQSLWSADNTSRYRQFCHQLSQTIVEQQLRLDQAERHLEIMRTELCQQQQKINVLSDVIARQNQATALAEGLIIQKELDDFATRQYFSR